ncbi:hypothetical protein P775_13625 [Puniceibacterium antarcticum]|uniref:Uncharacterized protein n=1 Tax=Puniceibacterium antarcticum TaxID=1206336 RepID=A0A2G8REP8_9RHOB|nr:hypothetical protein [Puniceibacterium antarcticum]PIL19558.1 hypothetical protein P775_13625 [Puniceibacterium antarcticum]
MSIARQRQMSETGTSEATKVVALAVAGTVYGALAYSIFPQTLLDI